MQSTGGRERERNVKIHPHFPPEAHQHLDGYLTTVFLVRPVCTVPMQVTPAVQVNTLPAGTGELFAGTWAGDLWGDGRTGCGASENRNTTQPSIILLAVKIFEEGKTLLLLISFH